jgi:hypothetical protein
MNTMLLGLTPNQSLRLYLIKLLKPFQREKSLHRLFAEANAIHNTILMLTSTKHEPLAHEFGLLPVQINFLKLFEYVLSANPAFETIDRLIDETQLIHAEIESYKVPDFNLGNRKSTPNVPSDSVMTAIGTE